MASAPAATQAGSGAAADAGREPHGADKPEGLRRTGAADHPERVQQTVLAPNLAGSRTGGPASECADGPPIRGGAGDATGEGPIPGAEQADAGQLQSSRRRGPRGTLCPRPAAAVLTSSSFTRLTLPNNLQLLR